jgi:hypothetical protein
MNLKIKKIITGSTSFTVSNKTHLPFKPEVSELTSQPVKRK